jgi:hypothetical protein
MSETNYKPRKTERKWEEILVGDKQLEVGRILIQGNNYDVCDHFSFQRWSNTKTGEWGEGLVNTSQDPRKVERVGLFGELAIGILFDQRIDLTYRPGGDQFDFQLFGKTVNVKMRTEAPPRHDRGIIKCRHSAQSAYMPLKQDLYVFGYLDWEYKRQASVCIIGGIWKDKIDTTEHAGFRGEHFNHEVHYRHLMPIKKLMARHQKEQYGSLVHSGVG